MRYSIWFFTKFMPKKTQRAKSDPKSDSESEPKLDRKVRRKTKEPKSEPKPQVEDALPENAKPSERKVRRKTEEPNSEAKPEADDGLPEEIKDDKRDNRFSRAQLKDILHSTTKMRISYDCTPAMEMIYIKETKKLLRELVAIAQARNVKTISNEMINGYSNMLPIISAKPKKPVQ